MRPRVRAGHGTIPRLPRGAASLIATVTLNPSLDEWLELPQLRIGRVNRAPTFRRYPGGKGINVSRVVSELGGRTVAIACAGGEDGRILSHLLRASEVPNRVVHVDGSTRNNYQIQTQRPRAVTQINCQGPPMPRRALTDVIQLLGRTRRRLACVVCSGSLPPGLPVSSYQLVLRAAAQRRALTVLDTSGGALRSGLLAKPWLIKPNREEAEELLGRRLDSLRRSMDAAAELARRWASIAIISLGKDGAVLAAEGRARLLARSPAVKVHSTVGAGDSLIAGFVLGWLATRSPVESLRLGIACATATVMTSGTELCHRRDVDAQSPRIAIEEIKPF